MDKQSENINISFIPKSNLEKFGMKVYYKLVENFPKTYFVGGMVRDLLLRIQIKDLDIATEATPEQVIQILKSNDIKYIENAKRFGVVIASDGRDSVEITTLRREAYDNDRFPKVQFIRSVKEDSKRRDFTVNSLYFSPKSAQLLDFNKGLKDLEEGLLRTVKTAKKSFNEDPLRMLRALRFATTLNFKIEDKTFKELEKNLSLLSVINKKRIEKEISKIKNKNLQKKVLQNAKLS